MKNRPEPRICIVQPGRCSPSETFLQAHADHLPARVTVIHGGVVTIGDRPIKSQAIVLRGFRKAIRSALGKGWDAELTSSYLKAFRRIRPDAVLAEYGDTGTGVMEACRLARIPLIVHFHGYDASMHDCLQKMAGSYPILFQRAAAIVAVSQAMRSRLIAMGAPAEKVHWNPCGVDCRAFQGSDPSRAAPLFLTVGRFTEKKAPHLTLLAFAEVHRAYPEARLKMIGFGHLLNACADLAKGLEIEDAVTFLGTCPPPTVQEEMGRARCFVQHSVEAANGDSEGTPVAILEAGASGLPVVSTRHGGIPDVVIEERTGLLVDERDVRGMAAQMLRMARDPVLAGQLGRAARAWIEAEFSMHRRIGQLWTIIEACIPAGAEARLERTNHPSLPGPKGGTAIIHP